MHGSQGQHMWRTANGTHAGAADEALTKNAGGGVALQDKGSCTDHRDAQAAASTSDGAEQAARAGVAKFAPQQGGWSAIDGADHGEYVEGRDIDEGAGMALSSKDGCLCQTS